MLNSVSDVINLSRRCSGVCVTVTLSTALDAAHSLQRDSHTNARHCPLVSPTPCAHPVYMTTQLPQLPVSAGSDGRKLIFLVKLLTVNNESQHHLT